MQGDYSVTRNNLLLVDMHGKLISLLVVVITFVFILWHFGYLYYDFSYLRMSSDILSIYYGRIVTNENLGFHSLTIVLSVLSGISISTIYGFPILLGFLLLAFISFSKQIQKKYIKVFFFFFLVYFIPKNYFADITWYSHGLGLFLTILMLSILMMEISPKLLFVLMTILIGITMFSYKFSFLATVMLLVYVLLKFIEKRHSIRSIVILIAISITISIAINQEIFYQYFLRAVQISEFSRLFSNILSGVLFESSNDINPIFLYVPSNLLQVISRLRVVIGVVGILPVAYSFLKIPNKKEKRKILFIIKLCQIVLSFFVASLVIGFVYYTVGLLEVSYLYLSGILGYSLFFTHSHITSKSWPHNIKRAVILGLVLVSTLNSVITFQNQYYIGHYTSTEVDTASLNLASLWAVDSLVCDHNAEITSDYFTLGNYVHNLAIKYPNLIPYISAGGYIKCRAGCLITPIRPNLVIGIIGDTLPSTSRKQTIIVNRQLRYFSSTNWLLFRQWPNYIKRNPKVSIIYTSWKIDIITRREKV